MGSPKEYALYISLLFEELLKRAEQKYSNGIAVSSNYSA